MDDALNFVSFPFDTRSILEAPLKLLSQHYVFPCSLRGQLFLLDDGSGPQKSTQRSVGTCPSITHNPFSAFLNECFNGGQTLAEVNV